MSRSMDKAVEGLHMAVAALTVANGHPGQWISDDELTAAHDWAKEAGPLAAAVAINHLAYMLVGLMRHANIDADQWIADQGRSVALHEQRRRQ